VRIPNGVVTALYARLGDASPIRAKSAADGDRSKGMGSASDVDCVVVGAGVVGLAVARALAQSGRSVYVFEECERPGEGISSRNSGVIHAGMYYATGSLKARCCVRGAALMYAFCASHGVAHRRTGKLIVASDQSKIMPLKALEARAHANGVRITWLDGADAMALEPNLHCAAALDSPDSGIVDVPEFVAALIGDIESAGGTMVYRTVAKTAHLREGLFHLATADGDSVKCRMLVNAAGLGAPDVAKGINGLDPKWIPALHYAQGHYYNLRGRNPFSRLIYPLPHESGLGVHLGMDVSGRCRFGPDVRWIPEPDYHFDDSLRPQFAASIREWWPALRDEDLMPDFVGVRPKLRGAGAPSADFLVQGSDEHGLSGLVNLFGIDSPGLTSSLALAEVVVQKLIAEVT